MSAKKHEQNKQGRLHCGLFSDWKVLNNGERIEFKLNRSKTENLQTTEIRDPRERFSNDEIREKRKQMGQLVQIVYNNCSFPERKVLIVRNIAASADSQTIRKTFQQFGKINRISVIQNKITSTTDLQITPDATNKSELNAILVFDRTASCIRARCEMDKRFLNGVELQMKLDNLESKISKKLLKSKISDLSDINLEQSNSKTALIQTEEVEKGASLPITNTKEESVVQNSVPKSIKSGPESSSSSSHPPTAIKPNENLKPESKESNQTNTQSLTFKAENVEKILHDQDEHMPPIPKKRSFLRISQVPINITPLTKTNLIDVFLPYRPIKVNFIFQLELYFGNQS